MAAKKRSKKNKKQAAPKKPKKQTARPEPQVIEDGKPSFWSNHLWQMLFIGLISCVIYSNTVSHEYAVDDSIVILRNEFTKKGMKGMHGIWTEDTFVGFFGGKRNLVSGGRYRPLSVATFALELQLFGSVVKDAQGNPILDKDGDINYTGVPHLSHFINLLLYAIVCMVLYLLLLQMFNPERKASNLKGYFIAFVGALLYATHPIHTEAVANIKGRDEIMVTLGGILAVYFVLRMAASESKRSLYLLGAILAFIFGIFSKENAITFLAIIPAALYFFTDEKPMQIGIYTLPFVVIALVFWFGIRQPILGTGGSEPLPELMNNPFLKLQNGKYVAFDSSEKLGTILYTWLEYLRLLVFPHPLTNDYYPMQIRLTEGGIPTTNHPKVLLSILIHVGLAAATVWGIFKRKPFAFFLIFYAATFSVVSNLFFPIGTNMAERFLFLPSIGFSGLCAIGLWKLVVRLQPNAKKTPANSTLVNKYIKAPLLLALVVSGLYSLKTFSRNFAWKDDYTLFTTDIETSPNSAKLNNAVSGVLQEKVVAAKNDAEREDFAARALEYSRKAINMHPTYNNAWLLYGNANIHLGNIRERQQRYQEALGMYQEAIKAYKQVKRLRPDHPDVPQNLGVAYRDQGKLLGQRLGQMDASIQSLEQARTYMPTDFEIYRLLGVAYGIKGSQTNDPALHQKAIQTFEQALEIVPNHVSILFNLEVAYRAIGDMQKSQEYHDRWYEINPTYNPAQDAN